MSRNDLKGREGDGINALLAAVGSTSASSSRWIANLLRAIFQAILS
jgi:hypothetical protein